MMALPADEVLFAIGRKKMAYILPYLSVLGVAAIYAGTNYFGVYHSYLYYELTRYNSVVNLTNRIASEYPKNPDGMRKSLVFIISRSWKNIIYQRNISFSMWKRIQFNMHSTIFLQDQGGSHRKNIHSIISTPMR